MHNFSTPKELQAAIDSNRRDRFSTLYHPEPTMTSSRDDRFGSFPHNGCDYPVSQPRHHMSHMGLPPPPPQGDMRYGMKRPGEPLYSKYAKYGGVDNPKVIVLQDGTPSMAGDHHMSGKGSPPSSYYSRTRSPPVSRDSDMMRGKAEIEAARLRGHHFGGYMSNKDWDSEAPRHIIEEERRRLMDDRSSRGGPPSICKDKNCNGVSEISFLAYCIVKEVELILV